MAKYWVGGTGTWDTSTTTHWATSSGGASGAAVPTASDDVFFDTNSGTGTCTINASVPCNSIQSSGSALHTLSHNAGFTVTIGSSTAGASSIALDFSGFTTYTLGNATTSAITFVSTSATVQTVNFNSLTTGNVTYNASSNGSWKLTGTHNTGSAATVTLTQGTLNANGQTCSWGIFNSSNTNTRSLIITSANITLTGGSATVWTTSTTTGLTLTSSTGSLIFTGASPVFDPASSQTYGEVAIEGSGTMQITNAPTVGTFIAANANSTDSLQINSGGNLTVTGLMLLSGNSTTNRLFIRSNTPGSSVTITHNGSNSISNVDFMDITGAGSASWNLSAITGKSGDCGGNSGITFTTSAAQTWSGTSGGNWSANAWTSRVPLPQDDVTISSAFTASQTITADMPRLGRNINWTGATGTPTWGFTSTTNTIFGSVTLIASMTLSGTQGITLAGRSSYTLTSAGNQYPLSVGIINPSGTYTLQDNFSTTSGFSLHYGTLNSNSHNVTCDNFTTTSGQGCSLTMGTSTWTLTGTGSNEYLWVSDGLSSGSLSGASSTITIANATGNSRIFWCGTGLTWGILNYIVSGSTGTLQILGTNTTIGTINFYDATAARTLQFQNSQTYTITGAFNVYGTSTNLVSFGSSNPGAHTINKSSGTISCNYLAISYSSAGGGATWYAGTGSTSGASTSGWIFTAPPLRNNEMMGMG